jgi:hypothetical protein
MSGARVIAGAVLGSATHESGSADTVLARVGHVRARNQAARIRLVRLACDILVTLGVTTSLILAPILGTGVAAYPAFVGVAAFSARLLTASRNFSAWSAHILAYSVAGAASVFLLISGQIAIFGAARCALCLLIVLYTFIARERLARLYAVLCFSMSVLTGAGYLARLGWPAELVAGMIVESLVVAAVGLVCVVLRRQDLDKERQLREQIEDIDGMVQRARRIARGDLSGTVEGDDALSVVVREMLGGLRGLVEQLRRSVTVLSTSTSQMSAMILEQDRGALQQASAVTETQRAIDGFAVSSDRIAASSRGVLGNAERTLENSERASERITALTAHMQRISELLEVIKEVSNKSEILALNAALEGTKAGDAGKGFSLVAAQMQRLAESTMDTVKDVKALITDIGGAASATVMSMEQTTTIAGDTTRAAREISLIAQEQGGSVRQIVDAMRDIATVTSEHAASNKETLEALAEIKRLAEHLRSSVHQFVLEEDELGP